jgi:hypothetical protein
MTPRWWVSRLYAQLVERQPDIDFYGRYVDGVHDAPTLEEKASRAFRRIVGLSPTNLTGLVVEATAERLEVQGFRFGDSPDADGDAYRIWQGSDFDSESELLMTAALTAGRSFVMVEPPRSGDGLPRLYAEDASQMVVAYESGRRDRRLAALKVWVDEWTAERHATLYLPGSLHKFRAPAAPVAGVDAPRWELRDPEVDGERNPLGTVPVFELRNRPKLRGPVRSEVHDVISDQDACNHIALNALIAAEYGAFRQKWATGLEVPRDPVTGQAIEPFDVAVNRILINESDEPGARFGDFNATDLKPYIELYESRVKHMAAVSQTPVSTFGIVPNVSAEALALSITGLVNKVARRAKHFEQPFEAALRLAFRSIGDPRGDAVTAETIWKDPEIRSFAQMADAAQKLTGGPVITPQTAQEFILGMTETQRARDEAWRGENDVLGSFARDLEAQAGVLGS